MNIVSPLTVNNRSRKLSLLLQDQVSYRKSNGVLAVGKPIENTVKHMPITESYKSNLITITNN